MRLLYPIMLWLALAIPALADLAAPKTVNDTLVLLRDAVAKNEKITDVALDFDQSYMQFRYDGGEIQIAFPDNLHTSLVNAADDSERAEVFAAYVQRMIRGLATLLLDNPIDPNNVFPVVRHQSLSEQNYTPGLNHSAGDDDQTRNTPNQLVSFPFVADMRIYLVEDAPRTIQFVTHDALDAIEMSPVALRLQAGMNTQAWLDQVAVESQGKVNFLVLDRNFETSLMLLPTLWRSLEQRFGSIVAVVAARDLVLFVDGDDAEAVADLRAVVAPDAGGFAYQVSSALIVWDGTGWQPFD